MCLLQLVMLGMINALILGRLLSKLPKLQEGTVPGNRTDSASCIAGHSFTKQKGMKLKIKQYSENEKYARTYMRWLACGSRKLDVLHQTAPANSTPTQQQLLASCQGCRRSLSVLPQDARTSTNSCGFWEYNRTPLYFRAQFSFLALRAADCAPHRTP